MIIKFKNILFLALVLGFVGCDEIDITPESNGLLKVLQLENEYLARNIFTKDDTLVAFCVGNEDKLKQSDYGSIPSIMLKLSSTGEVKWQKELPKSLLAIWKVIELSNGNFFVVASDTSLNSEELHFAIIDPLGRVKSETKKSFKTHALTDLTSSLSVDCIQLSNGNIATVVTDLPSFTELTSPHLFIFNGSLQQVNSRIYRPDGQILGNRKLKYSVVENRNGELFILGRMYPRTGEPNYFGFCLSINLSTLEPIRFSPFLNGRQNASFSEAVCSENNDIVFVTSQKSETDQLNNSPFTLRYLDQYFIGPELTLWSLKQDITDAKTIKIAGFPKNGFISKVKRTQDGGYLLLGTCNINSDQTIPSKYQLLLVKLNAQLQTDWIIHPNTSSSFLGADVIEQNGMFLIFGSYLSFSESFKPIVININQFGEIQ
ncbi:MAG: hypothetical protein JXQ87_05725 [Bacteroidia bacterium]